MHDTGPQPGTRRSFLFLQGPHGPCFGALAAMNYQGPITFESFSSPVVDQHLSNTLAVWRNLWEDSMDLGTHAREFMASGMQNARATVGSR